MHDIYCSIRISLEFFAIDRRGYYSSTPKPRGHQSGLIVIEFWSKFGQNRTKSRLPASRSLAPRFYWIPATIGAWSDQTRISIGSHLDSDRIVTRICIILLADATCCSGHTAPESEIASDSEEQRATLMSEIASDSS